jgi:hypothetical protein
VALKTILGKNRPDIAIEFEGAGRRIHQRENTRGKVRNRADEGEGSRHEIVRCAAQSILLRKYRRHRYTKVSRSMFTFNPRPD